MSNIQTYTNPSNDLGNYLKTIRSFPMLSFEEEQDFANQVVENRDQQSVEKLVASHLRLVVRTAMGFKGYGLPISELISEGNIGLVQAVKRFDPSKGYRLSTYAIWWIRASIQEYILRSWSLVKIGTTAAQKKLFFNLRKLKNRLEITEQSELKDTHVKAIAEELDVSEIEVINMNRRLSGPDHSLNAEVSKDGIGQWQDWLVDETQDHEQEFASNEELTIRREMLNEALQELNERERFIFTERRLKEPATTLDTLSKVYDISRERIRQIEMRSFEKIQKAVKNKAYLMETVLH